MVLHRKHARGLACSARPANIPVSALFVVPDHFGIVVLLRVDYAPVAKATSPAFCLAKLVVSTKPVGAQALRHASHKVDGTRRGFQLVGQSGSDREHERSSAATSAGARHHWRVGVTRRGRKPAFEEAKGEEAAQRVLFVVVCDLSDHVRCVAQSSTSLDCWLLMLAC